jgi:hypothetical protein
VGISLAESPIVGLRLGQANVTKLYRGGSEIWSGNVWRNIDANQWRGEEIPRSRSSKEAVEGTLVLIEPGTSVSEIESRIAAVPLNEPMTLRFAPGVHEFDSNLHINRGNITVEGKKSSTIIESIMTGSNIRCPIMIQSPSIRFQEASTNHGRWRDDANAYNTLIGEVTAAFNFADKQLQVSSTVGLSIGDYIMVFKETKGSSNREFATLTEVESIDGNIIHLQHKLAFSSSNLQVGDTLADVKIWKVTLLENVTVRNFSIRYKWDNIVAAAVNPEGHPIEDLIKTREQNWFPDFAATDSRNLGNLVYGNHRALCISGTHEANWYGIRAYNCGSTAFWLSANLEMQGDDIEIEQCVNKGVAGNGYGIEYDKTYWSDFINLDIRDVRHGISANILGGNGFNRFHTKYTNSNQDFHGGRDQGNIYLIDHAQIDALWLPVLTSSGDFTHEIDYDSGKYAFTAMSYRLPENEFENTVYFRHVEAATGTFIGSEWIDRHGDRINATLGTSNNDKLYAAPGGSIIMGGFGSDTMYGGTGNDLLDGGPGPATLTHNSDHFVFDEGGGQDTVTGFDTAFDVIECYANINGSIFEVPEDLLNATTQVGDNVILDLGAGNTVTIIGILKTNLTQSNFAIIGS